jgi:hypothetical protein
VKLLLIFLFLVATKWLQEASVFLRLASPKKMLPYSKVINEK